MYLDVYLKWYEDGKPITKSFITGKTLGKSGSDLDRMFLISSAITKTFHGGNSSKDSVISLNEQEQRVVVNALAEHRERQESSLTQTEQLLRRMTGSITAYMDALFLEAADRPGAVGRKMTLPLLEDSVYSESVYKQACEKAVNIVDAEKVALLQEQAKEHTDKLSEAFFGELAGYTLQWRGVWFVAEQIIRRCTSEEILAAPNKFLEVPMVCGDMSIPTVMAVKGVNGDHALRPFIKCRGQGEPWMIKALLDIGMKVSPDNYDAIAACVEYNCPEIGKALIDRGVDFEGFANWAEGQEKDISCDTYQ